MERTSPTDVGTRLLFENERIRVWTMELEAGQQWGPHEHLHPYVTMGVLPAHVKDVNADGTVARRIDAEVDFVDWHDVDAPGGHTRRHTLVNDGPGRYKNFIVELLPQEALTPPARQETAADQGRLV